MKLQYISVLVALLLFLSSGCSKSGENSASGSDNNETSGLHESVEQAPSNWYIRLVAEDKQRGLKTESSQVGELDVPDASKQAMKAVGTSSSTYIDIVFEDPANLEAGSYKSVFYRYSKDEEKRFAFSVITDDENANVTLTWHGLFVLTPKEDEGEHFSEYRSVTNPLIRQMKLVDTQNATEVQAIRDGLIMKYSFNMNGSTSHAFEWVVATSEINITLPPVVDKDLASGPARSSMQTSANKKIEHTPKPRSFDLFKPTMPVFQ